MAEPTTTGNDAVGMPQLDFSTFPNQIFWLVVTLVVMYLILSRLAIPRIGTVLAERSGAITNDIAAAEELKQKAAQAEEAYEKALADARAEAAKIVEKTNAEMRAELAEAIAEADAKIDAQQKESQERIAEIEANALETVQTVARETAQELLAELDVKADADTVKAAVDDNLNQKGTT